MCGVEEKRGDLEGRDDLVPYKSSATTERNLIACRISVTPFYTHERKVTAVVARKLLDRGAFINEEKKLTRTRHECEGVGHGEKSECRYVTSRKTFNVAWKPRGQTR